MTERSLPSSPVRRADGVLSDEIAGRAVLIDPAGTHVIELNAVGSVVWAALDGHRQVDDLVDVVRTTVRGGAELPEERVRSDVRAFLTELARLQLVQG